MAENVQYDPPPGGAVVIGWMLFCGGVALILYAFNEPIAVSTDAVGGYGGGDVVNAGLVQVQSMHTLVGGFAAICGMLMVVAGKMGEAVTALRSRPAATPAPSPSVPPAKPLNPTDY